MLQVWCGVQVTTITIPYYCCPSDKRKPKHFRCNKSKYSQTQVVDKYCFSPALPYSTTSRRRTLYLYVHYAYATKSRISPPCPTPQVAWKYWLLLPLTPTTTNNTAALYLENSHSSSFATLSSCRYLRDKHLTDDVWVCLVDRHTEEKYDEQSSSSSDL